MQLYLGIDFLPHLFDCVYETEGMGEHASSADDHLTSYFI